MIEIDFEFIYFLPFYIAFLIYKIKQGTPLGILILNSLFFFYIVAILAVTLFPIPIEDRSDYINAGIELNNNFIPLSSIYEIVSDRPFYVILRQIGGNLILLLPLGFFVPLLWKNRRTFWKAFQVGLLTTLSIESLQLFISYLLGYTYKIFDVDDLILNSLGFILGLILFKTYQKLIPNNPNPA